eukprot:382116_1
MYSTCSFGNVFLHTSYPTMSTFPDKCLDKYDSIFKDNILNGKYAFITGGGSGINFRCTEALMRHGCNVAIASRSEARLVHASNELNRKIGAYNNTKCIYFAMDITKPNQVADTVTNILSQFPRIDILVNGAAGNFLCEIEELSANAMRKVFEIDTFGTFYATQQVFKQSMKRNKSGVIVNLSATLQYRGTMLQYHAGAAKAANDALLRHAAQEWGRYGIRTVGIAPGPIGDTAGLDKLGGTLMKDKRMASQFKIGSMIPLQRLGTKKEIADACVFLVSDAASFITGEMLVVDGGEWLMSGAERGNMYFDNPMVKQMITGMKSKRKVNRNASKL